jgi:hypothetical protein
MILDYINTLAFLPALFIIPCIACLIFKNIRKIDPSKMAYGATASGILLTFIGIWQGLIGFDVSNTESSIPVLLEGLKTAFGSSIAGLFTSILINLFFVEVEDREEKSLENIEASLNKLNTSIDSFTLNLADANIEALGVAIEELVSGLEMGINTETKETITKFKNSIEMLREWQERYVDEIEAVTEAMDKNAIVTEATTKHLDKTNEVLSELKPVTESIAESIGWVQSALPSFRKRSNQKDRE